MTGAGFFVGRASAPGSSPAPPTATVTVTAGGENHPAARAATTESQPPADPAVGSSGQVTFGTVNLDRNPPATADQSDLRSIDVGDLHTAGGTRLRNWVDHGLPGRDDCQTLAGADGSTELPFLHEGSIVCGNTAKGRPFRLTVKVASADCLVTDAVAWNN
ncbi:hypothetical protein [Amycolatopsis sp. FDAARGOS 1241]|uniref:hypothetical protein n=1 Tax=Amycolatopsis sp. FDAARGOS 1241 TaxID=2778070 RepID=UPI00195070D8|nr:hypothetical protein [Amycolatopsis sp. FDAARGOS 1241]QRP46446.1 hypothetical protein I6J71_46910 [Amycolatopsis sp. FDAARGOS 1241]